MAWTFEIPAGLRFTCSRCGDCCRDVAVLLGPGERERLDALAWEGREDDLVGLETSAPTKDPAFRGRFRLLAREGGACVYLGAHEQCRIHEHFGAEAKPLICRLYPFGFRALGDRIAVDVAFSCRAVSEGLGAPLAERLVEWSALAGTQDETRAASATPRLEAKTPLAPAILWEIELHLASLLADRSLSVAQRVRCSIEYLRLATTGDPSTAAAAALRAAILKGLPARIRREPHVTDMDATQRAVFRQWLFLTLNPLPARFSEATSAGQQAMLRGRGDAAQAFLDAAGTPWIGGVTLDTTFDAIDAIDPGPLATGPEWIATFLSAKIVGQRFLAAGPADLLVAEGAAFLFLCHPLIAWTAKALAATRRAPAVEDVDVRRAIRLIDRSLGRLALSQLPKKQAKAFGWVMQDTDLVACATHELIGAI